jgi:hypothetical protein
MSLKDVDLTHENYELLRSLPVYRNVIDRLHTEIDSSEALDDFFNKWVDPDIIALISTDLGKTDISADSIVLGVAIGLMIAEYRTSDINVATE